MEKYSVLSRILNHHYLFSSANMKAVDAAIDSRQWSKAVQILELQDSAMSSKYYKKIADHYASIGDYEVLRLKTNDYYYLKIIQEKKIICLYKNRTTVLL